MKNLITPIVMFCLYAIYLPAESSPESLLTKLQAGGYTILFRVPDAVLGAENILFSTRDFSQCAEQRLLSQRGEKDAEVIGSAFTQQNIDVYRVTSSAYCRTRNAARLSFPGRRVFINNQLNSICRENVFNMELFSQTLWQELEKPVPVRKNHIIINHQCNIRYILRQQISDVCNLPGRLAAGEAAVLKPTANSFELLGCIAIEDWYNWANIPLTERPSSLP